jgi:oxazoline/thiazoline synthase
MLVKPVGCILWIGPIFVPNKTGCWNCLANRLKENYRVEVDVFGVENQSLTLPSIPILPTNEAIALNLAATEIAKWVFNEDPLLTQNIFTMDTRNLTTQLHSFKSDVNCNMCSLNNGSDTSIKLKPCAKSFFDEEGERFCSPEETLERLKDIVSPITGIVNDIKHLKVNDTHIYYTVRNLPLLGISNAIGKIREPDIAAGKGRTKVQAKVGCLAEAIERYNCTYYKQNQLRSTFEAIADQAIHPNKLLLFSENQYANRENLNKLHGPFNQIAKKFDNQKIIGWTAVQSLLHDKTCYIPSSYCYYHYPHEEEVQICPGDSNGCASGNTLEEAVFYAMLELIERDAVAIWWYNRLKRPAVDLKSFDNHFLNKMELVSKDRQREFFILDITTDLNIPCFVAVSWEKNGKKIFLGTGAHLNPIIGMTKAVNELNQIMTRSNVSDTLDINQTPLIERECMRWILNERIDSHPYFIPDKTKKTNPSNYKNFYSDDFFQDIDFCLKKLKNKNFDVFALNISNKNIDFFTTKLIIPGLRHFWSRLAPGRLYDVPTSLEWLETPKLEKELNPIPYFL